MFPPFDHAKFLGDAWKGQTPKWNLGSSGFHGGSWEGRGLGPAPDLAKADPAELNMVAQPAVMEALAAHLDLPAHCVLPTAGTTAANTAVLLAHQGRVLCERPYYAPIPALAKGLGSPVDWLGDWTAEGVAAGLQPDTKLVVFSSPNNPTGASIPAQEWVRIAEAAAEVGAMVLVDQVFGDLTEPTVAGLHPNLVSTSGLNKAWGLASARFGWVAASAEHVETYGNIHRYAALAPSPVGEHIALRVLPQKERCKQQLLEHLRAAHGHYNAFAERNGFPPATGITAFPYVGGNTVAKAKQWRKEGLLVVPGEFFGVAGHIRIGLGGSGLEESLKRLETHLP
ncbi:MAG: pyridoxal phosphate-dependent aminotransferase [Thermoplasmatota archaeon]